MTEYRNLTNKTPLDFFKEISLIPRGSGNEKQIAEHIEKFALDRGYFCVRDEAHNVFVRRNASCGCDEKKAVMFQAHTDMVCEKTPESGHDFLKDPIKLIIDGDIITADGTTLGADDGAGVAIMPRLPMLSSFNIRLIPFMDASMKQEVCIMRSNTHETLLIATMQC